MGMARVAAPVSERTPVDARELPSPVKEFIHTLCGMHPEAAAEATAHWRRGAPRPQRHLRQVYKAIRELVKECGGDCHSSEECVRMCRLCGV